MTRWVIDTNVISELFRGKPSARVVSWLAGEKKSSLFITTVSLAEIRFGIEIKTDPVDRALLTTFLEETVRPMFEGRVLEAGEEELLKWRLLSARAQKIGRPLPQPDSLIAAIAMVHSATVASRDVEHFQLTGIPLFNPWTGESFNIPG